jgi:hypothetical protein
MAPRNPVSVFSRRARLMTMTRLQGAKGELREYGFEVRPRLRSVLGPIPDKEVANALNGLRTANMRLA